MGHIARCCSVELTCLLAKTASQLRVWNRRGFFCEIFRIVHKCLCLLILRTVPNYFHSLDLSEVWMSAAQVLVVKQ